MMDKIVFRNSNGGAHWGSRCALLRFLMIVWLLRGFDLVGEEIFSQLTKVL